MHPTFTQQDCPGLPPQTALLMPPDRPCSPPAILALGGSLASLPLPLTSSCQPWGGGITPPPPALCFTLQCETPPGKGRPLYISRHRSLQRAGLGEGISPLPPGDPTGKVGIVWLFRVPPRLQQGWWQPLWWPDRPTWPLSLPSAAPLSNGGGQPCPAWGSPSQGASAFAPRKSPGRAQS